MNKQLNEILTNAYKSPAECQFALTNIRKYFEQNKQEGFDNLRMFINWTLHSQLDNAYVQKLLKEIDGFLNDYLKEDTDISLSDMPTLDYKLSFFKALKEELIAFLKLVDADMSLVTEMNKFNAFIQHFESIVADTPLVVKPDKPLKHLTKVSLSKRNSPIHNLLDQRELYWTFYNEDSVLLRVLIQKKRVVIPPFGFEIEFDMCSLITNKDLI